MRVAIVGSRNKTADSKARYRGAVSGYLIPHARRYGRGDVIVSGGCPDSPDEYAEVIWLGLGGTVSIHPVRPEDVEEHGSFGKAAFARNTDIVNDCDKLVAFWDGQSKGTKDSIDKALASHKNVEVIFP